MDTANYREFQNGCTGSTSPTGGFVTSFFYFSSSEYSASTAVDQDFQSGIQLYSSKNTGGYVRPVRAFFASCALGGPCAVGDAGPGGGTVFYDAGTTQSWGRYLEAAPTDYQVNTVRQVVAWGCSDASTGAVATAIGTGKANTATILTKCSTAGIAAEVANKYSTSTAGAGQWFLPSKDELRLMFSNRPAIGGFTSSWYWNSSEWDRSDAWYQDFSYGLWSFYSKNFPLFVRPVRAF